jgi:hypothetical protein
LGVVAGCIAAGFGSASQVVASVIGFDNSAGQFQWRPSGFPPASGNLFDPTLAPGQQAAAVASRSLIYTYGQIFGSDMAAPESIIGGANASIARDMTPVVVHNPGGQEFDFFPATAFAPGQDVGGGANWQMMADAAWNSFFAGRNRLLGQESIVGIRLGLADGTHYGFVDLNWQQAPPDFGSMMMYQPVAWGYESTPNTPITVPTPAGAAVAVCGALFAKRRRRAQ